MSSNLDNCEIVRHITYLITFFLLLIRTCLLPQSVLAGENDSTSHSFLPFFSNFAGYHYEVPPPLPLASLQSFTGIWDTPTARILPDWHIRAKYGRSEPYRHYGIALGLFDRLEIHGQFTEVSSVKAFEGFGYGYYKDRNVGARLVLLPESDSFPQIALGAYDPIGTSFFPSRYLVATKMVNQFDLTVGLGQGLLGGQTLDEIDVERKRGGKYSAEDFDTTFLLSNPFRQTRLFGGVEYHHNQNIILSAEYVPIKYEGLYGFTHKASWPVNLGIKYRLNKYILLQGGYFRGDELSYGISADIPLEPKGPLGWKREKPFTSDEKLRWQIHEADNRALAKIIPDLVKADGFAGASCSVNDREIWLEFINTKYLSHPKAFGRVAHILDHSVPSRIDTFYINLASHGQVIQSLKTSRKNLQAFLQSNVSAEDFLALSNLSFYDDENRASFTSSPQYAAPYRSRYDWYDFGVDLKVKTFLNNKAGFFKHKIFVRPRVNLYPWRNGQLTGEIEFTLMNQYDDVLFSQLEPNPTRTDLVFYERESRPRISTLAFDQHVKLPKNVLGRFSAGFFETSYAGIGTEMFRYFKDGRFGAGLEAEWLRKRSPDSNFKLSDTVTKNYKTYYLNLYAHLFPSLGIEAGLKIGQFLADDIGARLELRRTFKHFTLGAWYTHTDTDHMVSAENRGNDEKGVYIRVPFSVFKDRDIRSSLRYSFTSFTKDTGQWVSQPTFLYPMNSDHTLQQTTSHIEEMRAQ